MTDKSERGIKFRFWHNGLRQFLSDCMFGITGNWILTCEPRFKLWDGPQWDLASPNTTFDITIQQSTGLKDKNGVEIYEGDIFKDDYWWVGRATVEFANGMFGFECGDEAERDFRPIIDCKHIEVIGNIFEGVDK